MFTGLCAFPLTPFRDQQLDLQAFEKLIHRLSDARVDSICAMGSTGLYPYLDEAEFSTVAKQAVELAADIPVMVGIGALRTRDVLKRAELAQSAGVKALLLAPVSYHPLSDKEVYSLYQSICDEISVPLCVYENPRVTNFTFSDDLYREIAQLPHVSAIKIPGMPFENAAGADRLASLRELLPANVAIGVSGDMWGAAGMQAGCDLWLSVLGGLFPKTVMHLINLAQSDSPTGTRAQSDRLSGIWQLFVRHGGGVRVMASAAHILGFSEADNLPRPLLPLSPEDQKVLADLLEDLALD